MRVLVLLVKGCRTLTFCLLLTSCVVIEKDVQHVIPINVNKTKSAEVTIRNNNFINNKPICKNNNLFCN